MGRGNPITGFSPLSGLTELDELYLMGTQSGDLSPLSGLTKMQTLVVPGLGVTDLSPLEGMTALGRLWAWDNQIVDLSPLEDLTDLYDIEIANNLITDISSLANLANLNSLYLDGNAVANLSALSNLSDLQYLGLEQTGVDSVSALSGLTNLNTLYLTENEIADISPLSGLTNLGALGVGDNAITDLSPVANLSNLVELNVQGNPVASLAPLADLENLVYFDVSRCGIEDLSVVSGFTGLASLWASGNELSNIEFLTPLTNLTVLALDENRLNGIETLSLLTALTELNVSGNVIEDISPLAGLVTLEHLFLSGNRISDLTALSGLTNLLELGLYDNVIYTITPLIANPGIGEGDAVGLGGNPLGPRALCTDIPVLENRGAVVDRGVNCGDVGVGVAAPVITTDGGNGTGADYGTNNSSLVLAGTCNEYTVEIRVNGSATGVTHMSHATEWSYAATLVEGLQTFSVRAYDDEGAESPPDTINITLDSTKPRVVSATAPGATLVRVVFSESMAFNVDLQNPAFYTFDGSGAALTAAQVVRQNETTVDITVNPMTNGGRYTAYVATASPVDLLGNHVDPAANSADFTGVNPNDADTDEDGLPDSWELEHDLDINELSADDDPDKDGLTNLEEFDAGTDPNDPDDPPSEVFVALTGADVPVGGNQEQPWRTISFAMLRVARFATAAHPITIHVGPGIFEEKVAFVPHVAVVGTGSSDPDATTIRYFDARETEHVVMVAAENTALRDCKLTLPSSVSATVELLRVEDVTIEMNNVTIDGAFSPNALGVFITGPGSSDSVIRNCLIQRLNYGVWASDSGVNITRNHFDDIFEDAISIRRPVGKAVGEAPLLGDAQQLATSGFNQFGSVEDTFVRNNNPAETRAEFNDWGVYDRDQISQRIADDIGDVDFEPFLGSAILAGSLVVSVVDVDTGAALNPSTNPTALAGTAAAAYDAASGLLIFSALLPQAYTVQVSANGYHDRSQSATLVAGDITAITVELEKEDSGGGMTLQQAANALLGGFTGADGDLDGFLSFAEANALLANLTRAQFDQLDTNGDMLVSQAELRAQLPGNGNGGGIQCRRALKSLGIKDLLGDLFLLGLAVLVRAASRRSKWPF